MIEDSLIKTHAGAATLVEAYRQMGVAKVIDRTLDFKSHRRCLSASQVVESALDLWATGGERCAYLGHFCQDQAPATQPTCDSLDQFHEDGMPLVQAGKSSATAESTPLLGRDAASKELIPDTQCLRPKSTVKLDTDGAIIAASMRAAKRAYDGEHGYQPTQVGTALVGWSARGGRIPAGA